jgi:uncharacterized protein YneF (UPF0154 family)
LVFAFIPAIYPTETFFKKRGFENVIVEYQYLKKILYVSIFILITLIAGYFIVNSELEKELKDASSDASLKNLCKRAGAEKLLPQIDQLMKAGSFEKIPKTLAAASSQNNLLKECIDKLTAKASSVIHSFIFQLAGQWVYYLLFMIPIVPVSIIIKLLLEHARKEFRFYYAKGCFKIVSNVNTHELDKAKYFKIGLIWYNKFLKRNIGLHINDIMKIYSKIITDSPLEQNSALISISESFNSEDGLKPLRHLSTVIPGKEAGEALTEQYIRTTIKESSDLLLPIIGTIITIITTFILPKPPGH